MNVLEHVFPVPSTHFSQVLLICGILDHKVGIYLALVDTSR